MVDEYWIVLRGPRFKVLHWIKKTTYLHKWCRFEDIERFFENVKKEHPNWVIRLGVTRGNDIYLIR